MDGPEVDVMDERLFAPPGSVLVESSVMALARRVLDTARVRDPSKDWVLAFDWADDRRIRRPGTNEWVVLGPGFDVGVYERNRLPPSVIDTATVTEFVVKIRSDVLAQAQGRAIRFDPKHSGSLVLV